MSSFFSVHWLADRQCKNQPSFCLPDLSESFLYCPLCPFSFTPSHASLQFSAFVSRALSSLHNCFNSQLIQHAFHGFFSCLYQSKITVVPLLCLLTSVLMFTLVALLSRALLELPSSVELNAFRRVCWLVVLSFPVHYALFPFHASILLTLQIVVISDASVHWQGHYLKRRPIVFYFQFPFHRVFN